jgi:hypothetical protein
MTRMGEESGETAGQNTRVDPDPLTSVPISLSLAPNSLGKRLRGRMQTPSASQFGFRLLPISCPMTQVPDQDLCPQQSPA